MITLTKNNGEVIPHKVFSFPGGERSCIIEAKRIGCDAVNVRFDFDGSDSIIDLLLIANAIRNKRPSATLFLEIPYFPAARQDRIMTEGECFGLQVYADIIKLCGFTHIVTWDAHSDVLAGMFPAGVYRNISQHVIHHESLWYLTEQPTALVSPDAGASKKIFKLAKEMSLPVIEATKSRDLATGKITATNVPAIDYNKYKNLIVVDDICDGGRTFIELAKALRAAGYTGDLILSVTHGIFSNGKAELEQFYSNIITRNYVRTNRT